jgi:hypothetical protein
VNLVEDVFRAYGFTPFKPPPVEYTSEASTVAIASAFEGVPTCVSLPEIHEQSIALFVHRKHKEITFPDKRACIGHCYRAQGPVCLASVSVVSLQLRPIDTLDCVSATLNALKVLEVPDLVVRMQRVADCVLGCSKEACICELLNEKFVGMQATLEEGKSSVFSVFSQGKEIISSRRFDELLPVSCKLQGLCVTINLSELQAKGSVHE